MMLLLAECYREEVAADFREFFGVSYFKVGTTELPYEEFLYLMKNLLGDFESRICVEVNGLRYRSSRDAHVLMDLFDLTMALNVEQKDRQFYTRPLKREEPKNSGHGAVRSKKAPTIAQMQSATIAPMQATTL